MLLAFKHAADGSVWDLDRFLEVLVAVATQDGLRAVEALWRYVLTVAPSPPPPAVRAYLTERLPPDIERLVMGYGEQLMAEARQKGREEGREEGKLAGKIQMFQELLGEPHSADSELQSLDLETLTTRLAELQRRFRNRPI